jgi:hypothetical protein
MKITGSEVRAVGWMMMIKHLPAELLQETCCPSSRVRPSAIVQEDNTGTKHPAGAGIRASIFNSCNDATVRMQEVPLEHAPCYIIALSRMRSRFAQYKVCWLCDEWETYFVDLPRTRNSVASLHFITILHL